jgi:EAL domain-containing protein (putative c-di-GMP-specific phosphodiesterase class I)
LRRLPVDELKIDRQMLAQIDKDAEQLAFVEALIDFAKKLQYKVAIEGVEREGQLALLQASACDSLQGFYFSRPLLASQLDEFIQLRG